MNRCKDCKWWGEEHFHQGHWKGGVATFAEYYRPCTNPKIEVGVTAHPISEAPIVPPDGVSYGASDDYGLYFDTGPEFGCVHWAGKLAYEEALKIATEEVERQKQLADKRHADEMEAEARRIADQPTERP